MDQSFMKEKPIFPLVLKMALPMVISMLVNSLYNIVDSFFVAQVSEDAMTAISIVYPLQNLANAVGVGFGVGINFETNGDGAKMSNEGKNMSLIGHLRTHTPPQAGTPALPRPYWFQCVPVLRIVVFA